MCQHLLKLYIRAKLTCGLCEPETHGASWGLLTFWDFLDLFSEIVLKCPHFNTILNWFVSPISKQR